LRPEKPHGMKYSLRRSIHAQWRDATVLFQESKGALFLFVTLVFGGAILFCFFYKDPETGASITFLEALYGTFALLFFQDSLPYPHSGFLQIFYFIIPILGLVVVAEGVIRFGAALTNKGERGQKWQVAMASTYSGHVIICGIGKVGYRVALELLKNNREIIAIESNPEGKFIEKIKALGIPVILADARRSENLIKAGVKKADAVITCTDDDLANLDIALDTREINPNAKIVLRMFDPDLARRVERGFGIHTAFSVSALAAPTFAAASMRFNVRTSFYIGDELMNISEFIVQPDGSVNGLTTGQVERQIDLSVISVTDGEKKTYHPDPEHVLNPNSKILVMGSLQSLQKLDQLNRK